VGTGSLLVMMRGPVCSGPFVSRRRASALPFCSHTAGLKASSFDDLVEQLDQIKTIAVPGASMKHWRRVPTRVRSNFKNAKEKKKSS
jgi:hypothetical protein